MPSYKKSGVNFELVGEFRDSVIAGLTFGGEKYKRVSGIGHYAGLVKFSDGYLALHTDGIGTKTILALKYNYVKELGYDLIGMNVNDIVCVGAEPIAMVDYIAAAKFDTKTGKSIGISINEACKEAGISMIGGETASVPDLVKNIDISGSVVGFLEKENEISCKRINEGDNIIGLKSSGFHSNGFSLIRKIYEKNQDKLEENVNGLPLWKVLLKGTRIYSKEIMKVIKNGHKINGLSHITGGGLRNLLRLKKVRYSIDFPEIPEIFKMVITDGNVDYKEAFQVFNMGIGFIIIASKSESDSIMQEIKTFSPQIIGTVRRGEGLEITNYGLKYRNYY